MIDPRNKKIFFQLMLSYHGIYHMIKNDIAYERD